MTNLLTYLLIYSLIFIESYIIEVLNSLQRTWTSSVFTSQHFGYKMLQSQSKVHNQNFKNYFYVLIVVFLY